MAVRRTSIVCLICALLPSAPAAAEPRSDPASIWTFQDENDVAVRTDRFYTNGTRVGWTSPTDQPFVGEVQAGLVVMALGARLSLTHVLQSPEFYHQNRGFFQFDSVALSVKF